MQIPDNPVRSLTTPKTQNPRAPHFGNVPHPCASPTVKHEAKFIMNQTYADHKVYEWEGSYAYSSIVRGFLHLEIGIISLPISRREIDGYKVPSTYTTNFLRVLYICNMTLKLVNVAHSI
jgi:hypothetical protein